MGRPLKRASRQAPTLGRNLALRLEVCARAPMATAPSPRPTARSSTSVRCGPRAAPALPTQPLCPAPSCPSSAAPTGLWQGVHAHGQLQAPHPHPYRREALLVPGVQQGFLGPCCLQGTREDTQVPAPAATSPCGHHPATLVPWQPGEPSSLRLLLTKQPAEALWLR